MADKIKGLKIVLGADTSELIQQIYSVNTAIKTTQSNLNDINRALKFDPGNVELLKDKQNELKNVIGQTKDKIDAEKQALKALEDQGIDKTSKEFQDLKTQIDIDEASLKGLENQLKQFGTVGGQVLAEVGRQMQEIGNQIKSVGDKIAGVGTKLTTTVTVPIVAAGTAAVSSFAEVDKTMTLANKTMNNTTEEANALNKAMEEAAKNSTFGMADAANAALNFARAGLDAAEAANAMAPAMNLAAGEGGDLNVVSAGLVGTINSFHGSFEDAAHYADVFAAACNNSALDVDSLADNISQAAPVFSAAGFDVEDLALAMGVMANNGIDASSAANGLKTGIARLVTPAKAGAASLEQLGFSQGDASESADKLLKAQNKLEEKTATLNAKQLRYNEIVAKYGAESSQAAHAQAALVKAQNDYETSLSAVNLLQEAINGDMASYGKLMVDDEGNMRDFEEILGMLNKAFAGLSEAEQIEAASNIFGKTQMDKWLALINTAPEKVDELSESIHNSAGTTQEMADAMMGGFGGSIEKLKSSFDVLVTSLGSLVAEYLTPVIEKVQGLIDAFMALDDEQKEHIIQIAAVVAAIGPALLVIGKVVSSVGSLVSIVGSLATFVGGTLIPIITAISAPVLIVVGAIALVVAEMVRLYQTNEDFRNKVNELVAQVKANFSEMIEKIKPALEALFSTVKEVVSELIAFIDKMLVYLKPLFEFILTGIAGVINGVMAAATPIINAVNSIIKTLTSVVKAMFALFTGDFKGFASNMKNALTNMLDVIKNLITAKLEFLKGLLNTFGGDLGDKAFQWGIDLIENLIEGIKGMIDKVGDAISDVADVIASFIHFTEPDEGPLKNFHTFMPDMINELVRGINNGIPKVDAAMDKMASSLVPSMGTALSASAGIGAVSNTNTVSINVYGAQGQDVGQLADIIEQRISDNVIRRGVAFA